MYATNNITGRKRKEEVPWTNTTTKIAQRCARCDGFVEKNEKYCNMCRIRFGKSLS